MAAPRGAKRAADQPAGPQPAPVLRPPDDAVADYATSPTPQPLQRAAAASSLTSSEATVGSQGGLGGVSPPCERGVVIADALQRLRAICMGGTDNEAFGRLVALFQAINTDHYDQYRGRPCTCGSCMPTAGYAVVRQLRHGYRVVEELQVARHELQAARRQLQAAEAPLRLQERQARLAEELLQLQAELVLHQKSQPAAPHLREKKV
jgi:hypothetical protein